MFKFYVHCDNKSCKKRAIEVEAPDQLPKEWIIMRFVDKQVQIPQNGAMPQMIEQVTSKTFCGFRCVGAFCQSREEGKENHAQKRRVRKKTAVANS